MSSDGLRGSVAAARDRVLDPSDDTLPALTLLAVLLVGFNGLWILRRLVRLHPERVYRSASIVAASLAHPPYLLVVLVLTLALVAGRRELSWERLEHGRRIRVLVLVASFPVVWSLVTAEYNPYFDQAYHADRVLLLVVYALVWVHPGFAFLLAVLVFTVEGQFLKPFGHLSTTNNKLPKQVLVLFSSFLFFELRHVSPLDRLLKRVGLGDLYGLETDDERVFLWALVALVGASYFSASVSKLVIRWPVRENLAYWLPFAYGRGWLWHLDPGTVQRGFELLRTANPLMTWGTVVIEGAGVALAWRRRLLPVIVAGIVGLHLTIFAMTGILFKMWVVVLVAFVWFVRRVDDADDRGLFTRRTAVVVTVVVLLSTVVLPVSSLAWFQTNYDRTYTVEVVDAEGNVYDVGWHEMTPYALTFQQNRFSYVDPNRTVDGRRSTKEYDTYQRLLSADEPADIERLRLEYGTVSYDPERARTFERFLKRYFETRLCDGDATTAWSRLPSLPHKFWNRPGDERPADATYTAVRVRRETTLYTDGRLRTVDTDVVRTVSLDGTQCGDASR